MWNLCKKILEIIIFVSFFILPVGCFKQGEQTQSENSTSTVVVKTNSAPISTILPTHKSNSHYLESCLMISDISSFSQELDGFIILDNRKPAGGIIIADVIALNLKNQEVNQIQKEGERLLYISESPDKTKIAYQLYNSFTKKIYLVIDDINFDRKIIFLWKDEWDRILGWADTSNIIISKIEHKSESDIYEKPPELILFDLNTQIETTITPDFPNIYDWSPLPFWNGYQGVVYDKEFTRAVYMRWLEEKGGLIVYSLWDVEKQEELINLLVAEYPIPLWSPDGSEFVVTKVINIDNISYKELVSVTRDGKIKQLTYLDEKNAGNEIISYSWSPNGQFIGLLIRSDEENKLSMTVLDTNTSIIYDYCISGLDTGNSFKPLWSPDSNQMLVQVWNSVDQSEVILIDIVKKYAIKIAENYEPFAWLKE